MSTACSGSGSDIRNVWLSNLDRFVDEALTHMDMDMLQEIMINGT